MAIVRPQRDKEDGKVAEDLPMNIEEGSNEVVAAEMLEVVQRLAQLSEVGLGSVCSELQQLKTHINHTVRTHLSIKKLLSNMTGGFHENDNRRSDIG